MTEYVGNIKDIKAREKAATPGPWTKGWDGVSGCFFLPELHAIESASPHGLSVCQDCEDDIDFIAHAREDIPYLLAQLKDREEKLAAVKDWEVQARQLYDEGRFNIADLNELKLSILQGGE